MVLSLIKYRYFPDVAYYIKLNIKFYVFYVSLTWNTCPKDMILTGKKRYLWRLRANQGCVVQEVE